jgi:hypothetical protein
MTYMLSLYRKLAALGFLTGAMFVGRSAQLGADHLYDCGDVRQECEGNPYLEGTYTSQITGHKDEPTFCYIEWNFQCNYEGGSGWYGSCGFHAPDGEGPEEYPGCLDE